MSGTHQSPRTEYIGSGVRGTASSEGGGMNLGPRDVLAGSSAVMFVDGVLVGLNHVGIDVGVMAVLLAAFGAFGLGLFGGRQ